MSFQLKQSYQYPNIKKDLNKAKKFQEIYAGNISEFSLIVNYLYQISIVENQELKDILKNILSVSIKHLELIGILIRNSGLIPFYASFQKDEIKWFNLQNVSYTKCEKSLILDDIQIINKIINSYQHLKDIDDIELSKLIDRIILEKNIHKEILTKYLEIKFRMTC